MTYLKDLIETLRAELQHYGELLARFDDEVTLGAKNTVEESLAREAAIRDQEDVIKLALRRREQAQRRLSPCLLLPEDASLTDIIPMLPRHYQSLVKALADENMALSARVQWRARPTLQQNRTPQRGVPMEV